jgi:hypothetical protein
MSRHIKITAIWDLIPYTLVDSYHISEEPAVSIFRVSRRLNSYLEESTLCLHYEYHLINIA